MNGATGGSTRRRVFAANWKMNHGPAAARAFTRDFVARYRSDADSDVIFFPPALSLAAAIEGAGEAPPFRFGVQNIYSADKGAFTGENSAPIARDAGARLTLVGHSERRHVFGETNEQTAAKCAAAERAGLTPLLCVGETLEQREGGETESVVSSQLRVGLSDLKDPLLTTSVIAYEPVWAIGTGKNATPEDVADIHTVLRAVLAELLGDAAEGVRILYGGSVTPGNVSRLLMAANVDGVLVGGASLEVGSWLSICSASLNL
ncbi:MAG: triose-phosphate isomerase [Gemmatimonadaceae bacterium]